MAAPAPCGCRVDESPSMLRIVYCPTHAAAPELLAALKDSLAGLEEFRRVYQPASFVGSTITEYCDKARAAIAKAEGR